MVQGLFREYFIAKTKQIILGIYWKKLIG